MQRKQVLFLLLVTFFYPDFVFQFYKKLANSLQDVVWKTEEDIQETEAK